MASDATLLILRSAGGDAALAETDLLGLSLTERNAHAAAKAGFARVVVVGHAGGTTGTRAGIPVEFVASDGTGLDRAGGTLVVLNGNVLADPAWLGKLMAMPVHPGGIAVENEVAAVIARDETGAWPVDPMGAKDAGTFFADAGSAARHDIEPDRDGRFILTSAGGRAAAEAWLLGKLIKSGDSLLTRLINRRLSMAISRRLVRTGVTPNQVTVVSVLIGLAGAPFFLYAEPHLQVIGALLVLIHSIVDGCDGELARLKFQTSETGMVLDLWGDNVVHVALFACLGVGWSLAGGAVWPLLLAASAVSGTLWSAWLVHDDTVRRAEAGSAPQLSSVTAGDGTRLAKILNGLGNRDFLYGMLALAFFGKAYWLLPLVAIGSPLFAVGLTAQRRRR
ncbi:MAG: CDP-alcohol phosphatidyltransferase family protein [Rhodospirillales bacterium]